MEPLSLSTAAVTFLVPIVQLTRETLRIAHTLSAAKNEVRHLVTELRELERILENLVALNTVITQAKEQTIRNAGLVPKDLKNHQNDINYVKRCLELMQDKFDGSVLERCKARWDFVIRKKAHLTTCVTRIQNVKSTLTLAGVVLNGLSNNVIQQHVQNGSTVLSEVAGNSRTTDQGIKNLQTAHKDSALILDSVKENSCAVRKGVEDMGGSLKITNKGLVAIQKSLTTMDQTVQRSLNTIDQSIRDSTFHQVYTHLQHPCHLIPYLRNRQFVGRTDILKKIRETLLPGPHDPIQERSFSLHGMPGVGKTQTVLEFVYKEMEQFRAIFWIPASSPEKVAQGYVDIARALRGGTRGITADQTKEIEDAKNWLRLTDEPWLLVFDNLDDLTVLNSCPSSKTGAVLITSQNPASEHSLTSSGSSLRPFSQDEAVRLVNRYLSGKVSGFGDDQAIKIADTLGYHPLAISQMVTFILESKYSVAAFLEAYSHREEANKLQRVYSDCPWYTNCIAKTFDLTIAKLNEGALLTLEMLAFFDPDIIPERLLVVNKTGIPFLATSVQRHVILRDLCRYTLISINRDTELPERSTLSLHRLVRDSAVRRLDSLETNRQSGFDNAVRLLRKAFPLHGLARDHMVEEWDECEIFQPHVLALHERYLEMRDGNTVMVSLEFIELIYSCAWYLCERGRFEISDRLIDTAITTCQSVSLQDNDIFWADICTVQLFHQNETTRGETLVSLATKAHRIREAAVVNKVLDEDHPNRANGFMNLGVVTADADPWEAIRLHTTALQIREQSTKYTKDQIHGLALNYLNIGRCWWLVRDLEKAAHCFKRCLSLLKEREDAYGKRFPLSAWALWALGNVEVDLNHLDSALVMHTESMDLLKESLGESHLKTAACYYKVAWLLHKNGDPIRARELLEIVLKVYEKKTVDVKGEVARCKYKLAQILKDADRPQSEWQCLKTHAQELRYQITREKPEENDTELSYDNLIAYFYR